MRAERYAEVNARWQYCGFFKEEVRAMGKAIKRSLFTIANRQQQQIIQLVFFTTIVPVVVTVAAVSYLFFDIATNLMMDGYQSIPIIKKIIIAAIIVLPCYIVILGIWSYKISNRLTGPLNRIYREVDEMLAGKPKHHIQLRENDSLKDLVDRINRLIDKLP